MTGDRRPDFTTCQKGILPPKQPVNINGQELPFEEIKAGKGTEIAIVTLKETEGGEPSWVWRTSSTHTPCSPVKPCRYFKSIQYPQKHKTSLCSTSILQLWSCHSKPFLLGDKLSLPSFKLFSGQRNVGGLFSFHGCWEEKKKSLRS